METFGRIDTGVNNAAVSTYGTVEQMTPDELRRVVEVSLLGPVYGMKAALSHLKATRPPRQAAHIRTQLPRGTRRGSLPQGRHPGGRTW